MDGDPLRGYLDTCVVSAMSREDLVPPEQAALEVLLDLHERGAIVLMTSAVTKEEIDRLPEHRRAAHHREFDRIAGLPTITEHRTNMMMLLGVGGSGPKP